MSKYWMVFALLGAVGCSGNAPESAASNRDTVSEGVDSEKGKPDANGGGKGGGCGGDVTPPTDACTKELAGLAQLIAVTKDPQTIAALTTKFEIVKGSCYVKDPAPDPCKTLLANTQAYLDEAIKTGDPLLIAAAKEKYTSAWNSCAPVTDPSKPPPSTEGAGKGDPGIPPANEDPGTTPPSKGDPGIPPGKGDPGIPPAEGDPGIPPAKGDPGIPPPKDEDPCASVLSAAATNLEIAAKIGDIDLIIAAKEKYAAIAASCAPPAKDTPPKK
jgi:hypothetical protein